MRNTKMEDIKIKGSLTPDFVNNRLGLFLDALQNIQHTIDEIKQVSPTPVKVNEIRWEGVDTLENDVLSDMPTVTVFLTEAQKSLSSLRETLDSLSEETRNQDLNTAYMNMAKSILETLCFSVEPPNMETFWARDLYQTPISQQTDIIRRTGHLGNIGTAYFYSSPNHYPGPSESLTEKTPADRKIKWTIITKGEDK